MVKKSLTALAVSLLVAAGLASAPAASAVAAPPETGTFAVIAPPPIDAKGKPLHGTSAAKGMPVKAGAVSTLAATGYHYAGGHEADVTTGYTVNMRVEKPFRAPLAGNHTLMELTAEKTIGGKRNIVELGWNVDPAVNGDEDPHLFVFRWKDGVPGTYNGSGFVQYSAYCDTAGAVCAGDNVAAWIGTAKRFDIQYFNGAWWFAVNSQWIGWFPKSVWDTGSPIVTGFDNTDYVQGFGEVYNSATTRPRDDMGNGRQPSTVAPLSAYIASVTYINQPTTNVNWVAFNTLAAEYGATMASTRSVYLGGAGALGTTNTTPGVIGS